LLPLFLALAAATPAVAQDAGDDWDLGRDPAHNVTIAAVTFENFGVAVRCMDEVMSVIVTGAPEGRGVRRIGFRINDVDDPASSWVTGGDGTTLFAVWPTYVATELRRGGTLALTIPDATGRDRRIVTDIPASPDAVAQVFQACGRPPPEVVGNDAASSTDLGKLVWARSPEPSFPSDTEVTRGMAALDCTAEASGRLRSCRIESEFPEGSGFGRAATLGAHRTGRVKPVDGEVGSMDGRHISFVVRYFMGEFDN